MYYYIFFEADGVKRHSLYPLQIHGMYRGYNKDQYLLLLGNTGKPNSTEKILL